MRYIDQLDADKALQALQRECRELLWAEGDHKRYEAETGRLRALKASLETDGDGKADREPAGVDG